MKIELEEEFIDCFDQEINEIFVQKFASEIGL